MPGCKNNKLVDVAESITKTLMAWWWMLDHLQGLWR